MAGRARAVRGSAGSGARPSPTPPRPRDSVPRGGGAAPPWGDAGGGEVGWRILGFLPQWGLLRGARSLGVGVGAASGTPAAEPFREGRGRTPGLGARDFSGLAKVVLNLAKSPLRG